MESTDSMESTGDVQPCSKRSRQETSEEEEYEKYLQTAESSLKTLCTLTGQIPPPQWVTARLLDLQALITRINTARPLKLSPAAAAASHSGSELYIHTLVLCSSPQLFLFHRTVMCSLCVKFCLYCKGQHTVTKRLYFIFIKF
uniref:Uncharacterized protein n=1 Tax=Anguilla anguilla TaxID=7936 RepID=A0A0E9RNM9_ANGAN